MRKARYERSLTVLLSSDQYQAVRDITNRHEVSISEWLRYAVVRLISEGGFPA